jgi:hypothetical protein
MKYLIPIFSVFVLTLMSAYGEEKLPTDTNQQFPGIMSRVRITGPLDFCGEPVELESQEVRERLEKELLLTLWDRPQVVLWIKRSSRYMPIIESMLREHGMPDDLKYVAIIESALRPHAGSRKGAIGFWQFMKTTGLKYGLEINSEKDQRRNIFYSTEAAPISKHSMICWVPGHLRRPPTTWVSRDFNPRFSRKRQITTTGCTCRWKLNDMFFASLRLNLY